MPITTLPALSRTATTFKADVDTFFGTQLPAFATEANALETNVNAKEASAAASATTATTKAGEASASAAAALASQNSASASAAAATTEADEAFASATSANNSATTATTKASEAAASAASVVRDGSGGVAGLTLFKLNLKNAAGTITSWFTTAATAARTWTMPDKDGTVAMTSDITGGTQAGSFTTLSASGATTLGSATTAGIGAGEMGIPNSAALRWRNAANSAYLNAMYVNGSNKLIFGGSAVSGIELSVAGAGTVATVDASGNLGLGVTPSAWYSTYKAVEVGHAGNGLSSIRSGVVWGMANAYFSNAADIKYASSGFASGYQQYDGQHRWYTAPSGIAGNLITFTQAMTLDLSGNLLVGKSVAGTGGSGHYFTAAGQAGHTVVNVGGTSPALICRRDTVTGHLVSLMYESTERGSITTNGTSVAYNTTSDRRLKENIRPADAARFMDIEFVDFEWVDGRHDCGTIADQLQSVYPDLVLGEKNATEIRQVEISPAIPAVTEQRLVSAYVPEVIGAEALEAVAASPAEYVTITVDELVLIDGVETTITRSKLVETKAAVAARDAIEAVTAVAAVEAVYETVEVAPAIPAVTEAQTFPVYQQVNYTGLIGRMGTRVQQLQRTVDAQAALIAAMESRLSALEAA